jgi:pyruvate kinase
MSKLETRYSVDYCEPIIEASDAIMIGRGDLGVEIGFENTPSAQKKIIRACRRLGRPVTVATHMLESMTTSPIPTRAEASDGRDRDLSGSRLRYAVRRIGCRTLSV